MRALQRIESPAPFGAGVLLHQEEHEQEQNELRLPVAQLELDRQCEHGVSLIQRWRARQLVKVGIYRAPCLALALGLPRMALSVGCAGGSYPNFESQGCHPFTFSGLSARILGATTPRNLVMKPNVNWLTQN